MIGEADAIIALDRANLMRALGGGAIVVSALLFWFWLLVRNKRGKVPAIYVIAIGLMLVVGVALASWQVQS